MKKIIHSKSQESGISLLTDEDLTIFCPGVSLGGKAEIRMAQLNRSRKIFATSTNQEYLELATRNIAENGLSKQIKLKKEDINEPLPYKDNYFDFIYARFILQNLSKQKLENVLANLFKALKPGGHIFIVVKSEKDWESKLKNANYNNITRLITYPILDKDGKETEKTSTAFFHTIATISEPLENIGFEVKYIREYEEQLFHDIEQNKPYFKPSSVIEIFAKK